MILEKLKHLGMAASYDSCGGGKEKSYRDYGIPYEYQNFIYNCTQTSENTFINGIANRGYKYKAKKGVPLYEKNSLSEEDKKEFRKEMSTFLPPSKNERLNKANKCLLMKVLQDNTCMHDCKYCVNSTCKQKKESLQPKEIASSFLHLHKEGYTTGLFLSSAVHRDAEKSTSQMIESAKLLRENGYTGYIHLKVLPDAPVHLIEEMALYANRLSVNIEATTTQGFSELTSTKNYKEGILRKVRTLDKLKQDSDRQSKENGNTQGGWFCDSENIVNGEDYRFKSFTTQIILGANEETDEDIISRMNSLYEETSLYRTYFSAFTPVEGTALENKNAENKKREHKLYEADWLYRVYGFEKKLIEKGLNDFGNFSLGTQVKQSIASSMPELFPLDPNTASRKELLLVPGIGPKSADKIIEIREEKRIKDFEELAKEGLRIGKPKSYFNLNGKQTNLFSF